jgi:predicted lipoprotein
MNKKWLKYIVLIVIAGLLAYNSVYFKKLDAPKSEIENNKSNPAAFARLFWDSTFSKAIDSAITLEVFENEFVEKGAQITIKKYSHSQGVSDVAYMLQKFSGKVKEVTEDKIVLTLTNSRASHIICNIGNYFGNGVRDVTGLIKMGDFTNSMDYNMVSSELNKIVRTDVILPVKNKIKINDSLTVVGCVEIRNGRLEEEILPVKITINN